MRYRLIAFSGEMGSGKTTAKDHFAALAENFGYRPKTIKLAGPLYDIQNYAYDRIYKSRPATKDRKLLQFLGTDWGRQIDPNLWVNIWELDVKHANFFADDNLVILTDDVRFNNEAERINEMGGVVIRVESNTETRGERIPLLNTSHISESGIDKKFIHATVYNNNTLDAFHKNLDYLFEHL
jgi:hypothetical protein